VQCPSCGRENRTDARFCDACGQPFQSQLATEGDLVCPACGYPNHVRFCARCGEALAERPEAVRRRSPVLSQSLSLLVTIIGVVLLAALSTVAVRFALSFVAPTVSAPTQSAITPEQAIRRADLYVAEQYPEFLATEPTATLARDGKREVFVVGYTRGSATTPDDPLTTLIVLVDAETGETELLAPGTSQ
jgi:hypothetical protein